MEEKQAAERKEKAYWKGGGKVHSNLLEKNPQAARIKGKNAQKGVLANQGSPSNSKKKNTATTPPRITQKKASAKPGRTLQGKKGGKP